MAVPVLVRYFSTRFQNLLPPSLAFGEWHLDPIIRPLPLEAVLRFRNLIAFRLLGLLLHGVRLLLLLLHNPIAAILLDNDLLHVRRGLSQHLLHILVHHQVVRLQHVAANRARPPVVQRPHLHVGLEVCPKAKALQVHAGLAPHWDVHPLEGQRATKLQLVGQHARHLLVVIEHGGRLHVIILLLLLLLFLLFLHFFLFVLLFVLLERLVMLATLHGRIAFLDAPGVLQEHAHARKRVFLLTRRGVLADLLSSAGLCAHDRQSIARGMLVLYGDCHTVHARSQAS
mmetsp:Transcript_116059/g.275787  ORF Transcript_116059/g.275787 Transcript_116059/m.275787 type:complete len:285 (+) Transcript_116059:128-982(+)